MAIFKYTGELYPQTGSSSVTGFNNGGTANVSMKWAVSDQFLFDGDAEAVTANVLTIVETASTNVKLSWTAGDGAHDLTLTAYTTAPALKSIGSGTFAFADGGKLIFGDGLITTANDDLDNLIFSTTGNDYIDGLAGAVADTNPLTATGDTVSYKNALYGVTVTINGSASGSATGGAGTDKLFNIENITGSNYNDILNGDANANVLDGGLGIDTLAGGDGNDTYWVTTGDNLTETNTETTGTANTSDTVVSTVDWALGANIEKLVLTGSAIQGFGNSGANTITGNGVGNYLDGSTGTDIYVASAGSDTYVVDVAAEATGMGETTTGGTGDWVFSTVVGTITLDTNIENGRAFAATDGINITGNASNNIIYGGDGNNTLIGGALSSASTDNDTLYGLAGNDTLTAGDGNDVMYGGSGNDTFDGGAGNDVLNGGNGNDTLDGGTGTNTLNGGGGNDAYTVALTTDKVNELANAGTDSVTSSLATYTLTNNVENLTIDAAADTNVSGSYLTVDITGASVGIGNTSVNTITGNADKNLLDGGTGKDKLNGGDGNDTYFVDNTGDTVTEGSGTSAGTDEIRSSVTYTLKANVENLTLTGTGAINGTGVATGNVIKGNDGANTLKGMDGDDTLNGGKGNDTLIGGAAKDNLTGAAGNDTFSFAAGDLTATVGTSDSILDFSRGSVSLGTDKIDLSDMGFTDTVDFVSAPTTAGNQIVLGDFTSGTSTITGYIGADSTADFVITVTLTGGLTTVLQSDFIF